MAPIKFVPLSLSSSFVLPRAAINLFLIEIRVCISHLKVPSEQHFDHVSRVSFTLVGPK